VSQANQTFYATAAQALPVLFLVAAVERRVIGRGHPKTYRGLLLEPGTIPLLVFTMAIGEIASIQALGPMLQRLWGVEPNFPHAFAGLTDED